MIHQFIVETLAKYEAALENLKSQIETQETQLLRLKELYLQTSGGTEILKILKDKGEAEKACAVKEVDCMIDTRTD